MTQATDACWVVNTPDGKTHVFSSFLELRDAVLSGDFTRGVRRDGEEGPTASRLLSETPSVPPVASIRGVLLDGSEVEDAPVSSDANVISLSELVVSPEVEPTPLPPPVRLSRAPELPAAARRTLSPAHGAVPPPVSLERSRRTWEHDDGSVRLLPIVESSPPSARIEASEVVEEEVTRRSALPPLPSLPPLPPPRSPPPHVARPSLAPPSIDDFMTDPNAPPSSRPSAVVATPVKVSAAPPPAKSNPIVLITLASAAALYLIFRASAPSTGETAAPAPSASAATAQDPPPPPREVLAPASATAVATGETIASTSAASSASATPAADAATTSAPQATPASATSVSVRPPALSARELVDKAASAQHAGDLAHANELYEAALAQSPRDAEILAELGNLARARGNATAASGYYERALVVSPAYLPALIGAADAAWDRGERDAAAERYGRIVERFPPSVVPPRVRERASAPATTSSE